MSGLSPVRLLVSREPFDNFWHVTLEPARYVEVQQSGGLQRRIPEIMGHPGRNPNEGTNLEGLPYIADKDFRTTFEDKKDLVISLMAMCADTFLTRLKSIPIHCRWRAYRSRRP